MGQHKKSLTHIKSTPTNKENKMSPLESISENLKNLLETAKDLPTEKIAAVGLILIATGSIVKDLATGNPKEAIERAKNIIDIN